VTIERFREPLNTGLSVGNPPDAPSEARVFAIRATGTSIPSSMNNPQPRVVMAAQTGLKNISSLRSETERAEIWHQRPDRLPPRTYSDRRLITGGLDLTAPTYMSAGINKGGKSLVDKARFPPPPIARYLDGGVLRPGNV